MKSIINKKSITIFTIIAYALAILVFEIGYCNTQLVIGKLEGKSDINYYFSPARVLIYALFLILYVIFKNKFIEEAQNAAQNKYKRVFIYVSVIATIIAIIIAGVACYKKPVITRGISIGVITAILWSIFIIYVSNNHVKNMIVIGCTIGLIFSIVTKFNHSTDEKKHFMTAFNVSYFNLDYYKHPITDEKINNIKHFLRYNEIEEDLLKPYAPQITNEVNMADMPSTPTSYNFLLYVFPAAGIFMARTLGGSIIDMYILGRVFNLALYIILTCIALKLIPFKKNIFLTVFLMPMMVLLAGTFSIDGACIGLVSIFIAYCLKIYKESTTISLKQFLILVGLFALMLLAKSMAYILVGFMVFILPITKTIKENKKYIPAMVTFLIIAIIAVGSFVLYERNTKMFSDTRGEGNVDAEEQLNYMLKNPLHDVQLAIEHSKNTLLNYSWYDGLNEKVFFGQDSSAVFLVMMLFTLYIALTEDDYNFGKKEKIIFLVTFMLVFGMTSAMLYVTFTQVGALNVKGYQTRYIVPILPLVLFALSNSKVITNKEKTKNRTMNVTIVMAIFILISIAQSIVIK